VRNEFSDDQVHLDDQVCFAVYAAFRTITGAYRTVLDEIGITYPQYLTLMTLWDHDGASISELGRRLQLDSGTLSPLVRRLETQGLVRRAPCPTDERRVLVHLTDAGWAVRARAVVIQREFATRVALTPQELVTLRSLARKLALLDPAGADDAAGPCLTEGPPQ